MKCTFYFLLFLVSFVFIQLPGQAQVKIGYISIQELVNAMPEFKKATSDLDEYEKALIQVGQDNQAEFSRQDSIFKTDSLKWNDAVKEIKRRELNTISLKMINFNQEAQQLMDKKERELLAPIKQKPCKPQKQWQKKTGMRMY